MTNAVLSSTFFLTLLLMVGLFFFIRASTKDRIETLQFTVDQAPEQIRTDLEAYFCDRAYHRLNPGPDQPVILAGLVRPSRFLAVFLTGLAGIGSVCFALVLATLFPDYSSGFSLLLLLSPAAGWFYWRRARREETVTFTVEGTPETDAGSQVTVIAHRDELIALQQNRLQ
ncbi:cofactor assembly of complex C subunit B [filamentous cyanobacterium CCP5]|nr:cofactor assembly of complex C subunit B [filamentous cyanobacterium CCP5]